MQSDDAVDGSTRASKGPRRAPKLWDHEQATVLRVALIQTAARYPLDSQPLWAVRYGAGMGARTLAMWEKQDAHKGDRKRLFTAVKAAVGDSSVLYPGSYVDVAASVVFSSVTYVDTDKRAARFFEDTEGASGIIVSEGGSRTAGIYFVHGDYTTDLEFEPESFDLLVSLYAGFVSEACTDYLRIGGVLLVAPSHGDAAMASIDPRYELAGVVTSRSGEYRVRTDNFDSYLIPKTAVTITPQLLHERGRGIAYTKSPFAYIFTRTN